MRSFRAVGVAAAHGVEQVACVVQGRLVGQELTDAGIAAQPKARPAPAAMQ